VSSIEEEPTIEPMDNGIRTSSFGRSVEGRPIIGYVIGRGEKTVVLLGGLAGDETGGETLLNALKDTLSANPGQAGGVTLVVLPACNPDALEKETRLNANGVDLNLNFPSLDWDSGVSNGKRVEPRGPGACSEPETMAVLEAIVQYSPELVVSIHSCGACIDYEGPEGMRFASVFSKGSNLPVRRKGVWPGSLGACLAMEQEESYLRIELEYRHKRKVMPSAEKARFINAFMDLFRELASEKDPEALVESDVDAKGEDQELTGN
jgi:hypothetical protein